MELNLNQTIRELRRQAATIDAAIQTLEELQAGNIPKGRRGRKSMGMAERKVVAERMKRYWARRRERGKEA